MSKLWALPAAVALSLVMAVSCSDDDDGGNTPGVTTADVVGTWTGSLNLGMTITVAAHFSADSTASVLAERSDTTPAMPIYRSVGTYSVDGTKVITHGDTCILYLSTPPDTPACTIDTATVTAATTMAYTYKMSTMSIPVTLTKQP